MTWSMAIMENKQPSIKGARIGAVILDFIFFYVLSAILLVTLSGVVAYALQNMGILGAIKTTSYIIFMFYVVITIIYYSLIPYLLKGKTLGKAMVGIKVLSKNYQVATFKQHLFRNIFLIQGTLVIGINILLFHINSMSGVIGGLLLTLIILIYNLVTFMMIILTGEGRAMHDLWAKTVVVDRSFDEKNLSHVNILERKEMPWAIFEEEDFVSNDESSSDDIQILND